MVARILEQEKAIRKVLSDDRKTSHLVPTWQDIDVLESIQAALGPLADFTDMLSAENYVTVSALNPVLHVLTSQVLLRKEEDTSLTKEIKTRVQDYLENKYYSDAELKELLNVASFIDPRFMVEYIGTETEVAIARDRIAREGPEMAAPSLQDATNACASNTAAESESTEELVEPPPKRKKLSSWLRAAGPGGGAKQVEKTPEKAINDELQQYMATSKPDAESNPLEWWKLHAETFPLLAKLAKKYLCVCASSSASERLFSTSGHIASKKRMSLKPDKLNMLVFLAENL